MSNEQEIILGFDWDPQEAIDNELERLSSDKVLVTKPSTRLSPGEIRKITLDDLASAITNKDADKVKEILDNNPKFNLSNKSHDFESLAFRNFHGDVMDLLIEKFDISPYSIPAHISASSSFDMLKYFIQRSKATPNQANEDPYKDIDYDPNWLILISHALQDSNNKFNKKIIDYMQTQFDNIIQTAFLKSSSLYMFLKCCKPNSSWHEDILDQVDMSSWSKSFSSDFSSRNFFKNNYNFNMDNMVFLFKYMDDHSDIKKLWNESQKARQTQHDQMKSWQDKYLPTDVSFEQTPFCTKILNAKYDQNQKKKAHSSDYNFRLMRGHGDDFGAYFIREYINPILKDKGDYRQDDWLKSKLNFNEYLMISISGVLMLPDFEAIVDKTTKELSFESSPVHYIAPTFIHSLVEAGSTIVSSILKTKGGPEIIEKCLNSNLTRYFFFKNTNFDLLSSVVKAIPSLLNFQDEYGNSFAHLYASISGDKTKTSALGLCKLSSSWFDDDVKNKEGETLSDILLFNGLSDDALAQLNKQIIKSELKKDDVAGAKLRSRTKFSSAKRKM